MNISTGASLVPLIRIDAIVEWLLGKYVNKSWWCGAFSSAGNHGCPLPFIFLTDIGTWSLRASRNHMAGKIIAIMPLLSAVELQTGADWGTHRDSVFETGGISPKCVVLAGVCEAIRPNDFLITTQVMHDLA